MADDQLELNAGSGGDIVAVQSATRDAETLHWQEVMIAGFDGAGNVQQVDVTSEGILEVTDLARAASRGQVSGLSVFRRFGQNTDVDTAAAEDIEAGGGTITLPSAATAVTVTSDDAADSAAGTGARTVTVTYLDANHAEQTETVTMNGTSNVDTTGTAIRFVRASVATAGSGGENAGALTLTVDGNVQATIPAGVNQTLTTHYTIPADMAGSLLRYNIQQSGTSDSEVQMQQRTEGGVWRPVEVIRFESAGSTSAHVQVLGVEFAAKTDIRMRVVSVTANNIQFAASYELLMYPA